MGASAIERHITLSKSMYGSDKKASLEPDELMALLESVRDITKIRGHGAKEYSTAEKNISDKLRYFDADSFTWN